MRSRRSYAIAAVLLAAIIFVALNIAVDASFTTTRLDLTASGQYTLAQGTKNVIAKVQEPIDLKFFFSKKAAAGYAQVSAYAGRVRDLLNEYAALSHGKIRLQEIDPTPFSEAEDLAQSNGLTGLPSQSGDPVYFGLVGTNTIGGKETVPFFAQDREPFLEYDLSTMVYRLSNPKKPKLAILSSIQLQAGPGGMMAMMQGKSRPFVLYQQLAQTYEIKMLQPNVPGIPNDVDVLLIVHPNQVSDAQLYAIDQFVLRGGRAMVMVDPASELAGAAASQGFGRQQGPTPSDLPLLLKAWGVSYEPAKVIGDRDLAQPVQTNDPRSPIQPYPVWLHLATAQFNHTDQVTANLQSMTLATVGALTPLKGASTTFTPLLSSSGNASLLDTAQLQTSGPDQLMAEIVPTGRPVTIAARISGPAKTAFPKGAPKAAPDKKTPQPKQPAQIMSAKNINLIVLADTDIFDDKFWVRIQTVYGRQMGVPFTDNAAFVLNSIENLTGSGDLISLRTRATSDRPFTRVRKLQEQAQAKFQQQAKALQEKLAKTQERLQTLQQGAAPTGKGGPAGLSAEQQREILHFRHEAVETRGKLREVQRNLRSSIDRLGNILTFVNIALVPLLVALFAIALAVVRRRRRARAIAF
ncbi:MAG: Gldg family protein [Alphaproteobacteria bacterium]|nr:Gldg family protein [Alphaproteobacteria bacterium]